MAGFSLSTFEWSKNILHKYFVFHAVNSKTWNKESQINIVYLIYAFCVVLSFLLAEVTHGEREKWEKWARREWPLLAGNRFLLRFVKLRAAFVYVSTFVFRLTNVYLLATINPLCLFQCLLPFFHFLEFDSWRSFQFGSGICKYFKSHHLLLSHSSHFLLQKHAVTLCRLGVANCTVQFSYVLHETGKGTGLTRSAFRHVPRLTERFIL